MELHKIELLLEKYFQGETSIAEEKELRAYFASSDVAQHLEQYRPMFSFFTHEKNHKSKQQVPLKSNKRYAGWLSIAASVVVLLGIAFAWDQNQETDLGTYDNPEAAFRETQKALSLLSGNVNKGIESVQYVQEYENSKNLIFKK